MKLTILGTAPGKSLRNRSHSSILVEANSYNFMVDCGEGTTQKMLNYEEDYLDFIVISHLHPDHFTGIFILIQYLYLQGREKPLTLFVPENEDKIRDFFTTLYVFQERLSFELTIEIYGSNSLKKYGIEVIKNNHLNAYASIVASNNYSNKLVSNSFYVVESEKRALLSADLSSVEVLEEYYSKSDVLILDGIHPQRENIFKLIKNGSTRVYVTHGYDVELNEKFRSILNTRIRLAFENEEIIL